MRRDRSPPATPGGLAPGSSGDAAVSSASRSSTTIARGVTDIFTKRKLDAASLDDLEDVLIQADLGLAAATRIREAVGRGRYERGINPDEVKLILADEVERALNPVARPLVIDSTKRPFVILVIGVNGSGKTTTLYSALSDLNKIAHNICTAEDPVEYNLHGINQVQMHDEIGLNFAMSLRAFLRQDPDIIMVGEVRDFETAEIAVKAALTGLGYNVEVIETADNEALRYGKEFGNRGQCNPTYFTVGNLVKFLSERAQRDLQTVGHHS